MKRIPGYLLLILITGCAPAANYGRAVQTWVGADMTSLIETAWGYPHTSYQLPNGNTVYLYEWKREDKTPLHTTITTQGNTTFAHTTGGETRSFWCKTFFEVDAGGIIINVRWDGNDCWTPP